MTAAPSRRSPATSDRRWIRIAASALVAVAAVTVAVVVLWSGGRSSQRYVYDIPAGTGVRLDAGETVEIVPSRLVVHVGDRLVLRNHDDRLHHMGALTVDADSRMELTFGAPGVIEGVCSLNRAGTAKIVVEP